MKLEAEVRRDGVYALLDAKVNEATGGNAGFSGLVSAKTWRVDAESWLAAAARYESLRSFQETTLALFRASLSADADPRIAQYALGDVPEHLGAEYHRSLTDRQTSPPMFFRTDEVIPGKVCEIQCPGSLWGLHELLYALHEARRAAVAPGPQRNVEPLSRSFVRALHERTGGLEPLVHHYLDGSTNPSGMRFFLQRTRRQGLRYYGFDRDVAPRDCNVVRQHIFAGHMGDKFAPERLARCEAGELWYDLPPTPLFSQKVPLTFPFWDPTRDHYPDRVRDLFPHTSLVTPSGVRMPDGRDLSIDDFCALPASRRGFYFKYGGADVTLSSRGKGVFYARTFSRPKLRRFFEEMLAGWDRGRFWICQEAHTPKSVASYLTRDGEVAHVAVHTKTSTFYGPGGLMGMLRMQHPFYKVHGADDTILSIPG